MILKPINRKNKTIYRKRYKKNNEKMVILFDIKINYDKKRLNI